MHIRLVSYPMSEQLVHLEVTGLASSAVVRLFKQPQIACTAPDEEATAGCCKAWMSSSAQALSTTLHLLPSCFLLAVSAAEATASTTSLLPAKLAE